MKNTTRMQYCVQACNGLKRHSQDDVWSWIVCISAFMSNAVVCGILTTFGLFLPALIDHFRESRQKTAWIPSIALSLQMMAGPVSGYLCDKLGCRITAITGGILCILGLIISSVAHNIETIIFSFGILFGVGSCFVYVTGNLVVSQHFANWRSLAIGIVTAAEGAGGFAMSPIVEVLLEAHNWRTTFRILAALTAIAVMAPLVYSQKTYASDIKADSENPRLGAASVNSRSEAGLDVRKRKDYCSVWKNAVFTIVTISSAVASFSQNIPMVHMAKHTEDLGFSEKQASKMYLFMGISVVITGPLLGGLCRYVSPTLLLVTSMLVNGIATILFPLATSYPFLLLYSILYGVCDAGFVAVGDIMIINCVSEERRASSYGLYFMLLAVFSVPGPPLAGFLADRSNTYSQSFYMSGSISLLAAIVLCFLPFLERRKATVKRTENKARNSEMFEASEEIYSDFLSVV